jgi:Membrane proteins related to metalloendopeptidases
MIEIQIVPSDIRRSVRYVFFDRYRVVAGIVLLSLILVGVIGSMGAAPTVIRRVYKNNDLANMREESGIQRERLHENVAQMTSLEKNLEEHRIQVEKLITVYGLDRSLGAGGFSSPLSGSAAADDLQVGDARHRELALLNAMKRLQDQLDLLSRYELANRDLVRHTPSILPLPADQFVLTSPFGSRISPFTRAADFHKGLDLSAPTGTPIYAAADGVVSFAGRYPLRENVAWWRFGNVVVGEPFRPLHHHLRPLRQRPRSLRTAGQAGRSHRQSRLHRMEHQLPSPLRGAQRSGRAGEVRSHRSAHLHPQLPVEQ